MIGERRKCIVETGGWADGVGWCFGCHSRRAFPAVSIPWANSFWPASRRVAYNLYGDEAHFPVVLFHGLGESRNSVAIDEEWLRQKQWSAVSFDRPGVGGSDPLPGYTLEGVAADAAALAAHLGHERCAAFGWSAGGPFAMAFALGFPDMVDFLALAGLFFRFAAYRYRRDPEAALEKATAQMALPDRQLLQSPAIRAAPRQSSDDSWGRGRGDWFC